MAGDVPRVDGQLAVARAFGDKSLKVHLSAKPDIREVLIDDQTELLILASDGLWKVWILQPSILLNFGNQDLSYSEHHQIHPAVLMLVPRT